MYPSKQQQTKKQQILLKNGWTIADKWYCWPHLTTWPSWLPGLAHLPPLMFLFGPVMPLSSPTVLSSTLTPSLAVLPLHTLFWTNAFTLKSLPKFQNMYPNAPISQLICLSGFSVSTCPPLYLKAKGRLSGPHGGSFSCLELCWTRLEWLGRQGIMS